MALVEENGSEPAAAAVPQAPATHGDVSGRSAFKSAVMFRDQAEQVRWLRAMVDRYRGDTLIHDKAADIAFNWASCPTTPTGGDKARLCQAVAIGRWVQQNIRYVNEGAETFQSPVRTLTARIGDCDDFTTLVCALLESIGIRSELVGLQWGGSFRHIFPRAVIGGRRIPLDATLSMDVAQLTNPIAISLARGDNPSILAV